MPRRKAKYGGRPTPKQQLCWTCAKSTNGNLCPWVRDYSPVPGWDATPITHYLYTDKTGNEYYENTYSVHACPLYLNDNKARQGKPLILIAGQCASGKDYLAQKIAMKYHLNILKSNTTRPPRSADEDTHTFVTPLQYAQDKAQRQIIAETFVNEHIYYCTKQQLAEADIYIVDPKGISDLKDIHKRAVYKVLITADNDVRNARLVDRLNKELEHSTSTRADLVVKYRNRVEGDAKAYAPEITNKIDWDIIIENNNNDNSAYKQLKKFMTKMRLVHHLPFIK